MRRESEVSAAGLSAAQPRERLQVEYVDPSGLVGYARNARRHSRKQITQIAASIREFGFNNPILVGPDSVLIAGHARLEAARQLTMTEVPVVRLGHLSDAQRRAYIIADNRLAELSDWSVELLELEVQELAKLEIEFPLEIVGFEGAQLEQLTAPQASKRDDKADLTPVRQGPAVTQLGDIWLTCDHRVICGDALRTETYAALMPDEQARVVFTDPPFNLKIDGHVSGLGNTKHREFLQGSGEMSRPEFTEFLRQFMSNAAGVSVDGAIHFIACDWRHLSELTAASEQVYSEFKQLIVWMKSSGGMGTFYRSRHEFFGVYKVGTAPHTNTFGLGDTGRYRTNCWEYPGVNTFGPGRDEALAMHPTVKPVALVADAIRDVSHRGEVVLDPFGGSGTTLIAAEKTSRKARLIDLDPLFVDVICRRWAAYKGEPARLKSTGQTFDEVAAVRAGAG